MAMNKNLEVGSILFTYVDTEYAYHNHRFGRPKYTIRFKLLYVYNRRERTSGTYVSSALIPTLEKLGIRYVDGINGKVCAIGCRSAAYHEVQSDSPYPTAEDMKTAQRKLEAHLQNETSYNRSIRLFEIDFIKTFKEKKMSNKDALFVIQKPLEEFINNESYIG